MAGQKQVLGRVDFVSGRVLEIGLIATPVMSCLVGVLSRCRTRVFRVTSGYDSDCGDTIDIFVSVFFMTFLKTKTTDVEVQG